MIIRNEASFATPHNQRESLKRKTKKMQNDIKTTIREIVASQLEISVDEVENGTIFRDMGSDSIDDVEIAMKVEEIFDLDIPDTDFEGILTIDAAAAYVEEKMVRAACS